MPAGPPRATHPPPACAQPTEAPVNPADLAKFKKTPNSNDEFEKYSTLKARRSADGLI